VLQDEVLLLPCARGNVRWRGCSQVCGFRRGWPGPRWASARDPLAEKGGPVGRAFFVTQGLVRRVLGPGPKLWQPDRGRDGRSSPTAGGKTGRWPRVWRRSGQPRRPLRQPAPPHPGRPPLQRRTDAPAAPRRDRGRQTGRVPPRAGFGNSTFRPERQEHITWARTARHARVAVRSC
jgi:hypothetical protein